MNKFMMKSVQTLCLAAMALSLVLTSCKKEEDDKGRPYYTKFVDINVTRCERVSGVLMVDFTVTNKTDDILKLVLNSPSASDNTGTNYYETTTLAFEGNSYYHRSEASLTGKGTLVGHVKVRDFDPADRASSVNLEMNVGITGVELADKPFEQSRIAIIDNRVKAHGVQTNDTKLAYQVISCVRNGNDVDLQFSVTNNTGQNLTDFGMGYAYGGEAKVNDNLGNSYDSSIRFAEGEWYHFAATNSFAPGSSIQGTIRMKEVKATATEITVLIGASAKNYICEDDYVRFLTIPIQ